MKRIYIFIFLCNLSCGDLREDMKRIGNSKYKKKIGLNCPDLTSLNEGDFYKKIVLSKNYDENELSCKTFSLMGEKYSELIFFSNNHFKIYELSNGVEKKLVESQSGNYEVVSSNIEILPKRRKFYKKIFRESCLEINYKVEFGKPLAANWKWCL